MSTIENSSRVGTRLLRLTLLALAGYLTAIFGVIAATVLHDLYYSAVHANDD